MLPIKLVIEAFGPYRDRQTVDFTQFADKFLIWGETGAGKTVLLDAMTAALYNRTSAEERGDTKAMRCQMASADQETLVEFTFKVRGRMYRFYKKLRPIKRRKAGAEEDYNMECGALEIVDGSERPLMESSKPREQETVAEHVIGMGYQQFVQVMVLPQGKFERFLTADSAEKEKILKNIFRTDRFNAYQDSLHRMYRTMDAEVRQMEGALVTKLGMYQAENMQQLAQQLEKDRAELEAMRETTRLAQEQFEEANANAARAERLGEQFRLRDESAEALALLEAQSDPIRRREVEIGLAERAAQAQQALDGKDRAQREHALAQDKTRQEEEKLQAAYLERRRAAEELTACEAGKKDDEALKGELIAAQQRLPELARLDAAQRAQKKAQEAMGPARRRAEQIAGQLEECAEREQTLRQRIAALEQRRELLPEAQRRCDRYAQAGKCLARTAALEEQEKKALAAQERARKAREETNARAAAALAEETRRQEEYFSNAAYALSKRLEDGKPCPVCGSIHHPNVHQSAMYEDARGMYLRAQEAVRGIQKELTDAAALHEGAQARLRGVREQLQQAREELAGCIDYDAAAEKQALEALEQLNAEGQQLTERKNRLQEEQKNRAHLEAERDRASAVLADCTAKLAAADAALKEIAVRVGETDENAEQLQARILEMQQLTERYAQRFKAAQERDHAAEVSLRLCESAAQEAKKRETTLEAECAAAQEAAAAALVQQRFADEAECRAAQRTPEEISEMRAAVRVHGERLAAAQAQAQAAQQAVEGQERPDAQKAAQAREEAQKAWNDALSAEGAKRTLTKEKEKLLAGIEREGGKLESMRAVREKMRLFSECFTYAKGVTLSSYVLSAMLEAVAQQANALLMLVHGGRYRLNIKKASTKAKLDGLELAVHDAYTGQERDVRTLSGGEKFLVSLSLSLGLSAVVRAQAGGISMEAMFIDEGFGTLDPRSVKDALDVLTRIGKGSRVGIISHVDVLRENILQGIEVVKSDKGSRVIIRT